MTLDARKHAELVSKCAAFKDELAAWKKALPQIPRHTSQIERLSGVLGPLADALAKRIDAAKKGDVVARGYELGGEVLVLFRIWAFYRHKLGQRFVPWHRDVLDVADEVAFRFWKPARDAAIAAAPAGAKARVAKEPPLVFFNGDVSPFTMTRKVGFAPEEADGLDVEKIKWAERVIRRSPVPVIGVPYFAARHIPDLMVLAHEVGHNVEDDFGLTDDLATALSHALQAKNVGAERREAWGAWLGEVFADLWGVLVGGPAFVDALVDFIADDTKALETEKADRGDWGLYPTTIVRAELLFTALHALDLNDAAKARREAFRARYAKNAMDAYENDLPAVVGALLDCAPKNLGVTVREASGFKANELEKILAIADDLAKGRVTKEKDTARVAQAAVVAFAKDPAALSQEKRVAALWANLRATVEKGARSTDKRPVAAGELTGHDAAVADDLFAALTRWSSTRVGTPRSRVH